MAAAYASDETLTAIRGSNARYYDYGDLDEPGKTRNDFMRGIELAEAALPAGRPKRIFDIGYGSGFFLALARSRGWVPDGIDTSTKNLELSRKKFKLALRAGDFEREVPEDPVFDVVSLWDVIEHFSDPRAVLRKITRILVPGGLLLMAVPNDRSFLRYCGELAYRLSGGLFRAGIETLYFLEHVSYFSRPTLRRMLDLHGFREVDYFYTSTDLARYDFPWYKRVIAAAVLWAGRVFRMENRVVMLFRKEG